MIFKIVKAICEDIDDTIDLVFGQSDLALERQLARELEEKSRKSLIENSYYRGPRKDA